MDSRILDILTRPLNLDWSVQGLGMMRTYLNDKQRLHLWHNALAIHGATQLHDHPWDFTSEVILGQISQVRFKILEEDSSLRPMGFMKQKILCGEGGGPVGEPEEVKLMPGAIETYNQGDTYSQTAEEIHHTIPMNGTVTIITREYKEDCDHANVFFARGGEFVSAHPRPATRAEILFVTREVLHAYQEASEV